MSNPVRRCAGCRLKVETLRRFDDGRSYCGSCAERLQARLDGRMTTASAAIDVEAGPPLAVPGPREEPRMQQSTTESPPAPPEAAAEPPPPTLAAASAVEPVTPPLPPMPPPPVAPRDPRQTLELLTGLLQEHDRLLSSRAELAAQLGDLDEQLRAVAGRIDGVHSLLRPDVA